MDRALSLCRYLAIGILIVHTCGALAETSPVSDAAAPERMLRAYLDDLSTLRADFRQEVIDRDYELIEDSRGRVTLKKPGRFRWDYVTPFERVISADGERVWLYEADLEQVTIRRLDAGIGATPAALLTGADDVLSHFEYVGARNEGPVQWLQLAPRSPESDFAGIDLAFSDDQLVKIFLTDRLGQQTRIFFDDIERGVTIADAFFRFDIPDGVDVIDEDDI